MTGCDMVFNAAPMGMSAADPLPAPPHLLTSSMFVGDVIAGHGVAPLLQAARAAGCKTAGGVQMVEAVTEIMPAFLLGK
jgi:shikimate dehydrogenase